MRAKNLFGSKNRERPILCLAVNNTDTSKAQSLNIKAESEAPADARWVRMVVEIVV